MLKQYGGEMPDTVSPLLLALVAGGFTVLGVLLKIVFDVIAARRAADAEHVALLAPERREAYERFLGALRLERDFWGEMHKLAEAQGRGEEVEQQRLDDFPRSPMGELMQALDEVRRVARTYPAISSAENIVRLFADMAAASRAAITEPGPNDKITWFLLQRFQDDREREFVYTYREDLGLGPPVGAPKQYPVVERPWPLDAAEAVVRGQFLAGGGRGDAGGS
jgi:hypothetical protein